MNLESQQSFSTYIIGNSSLCIQCATLLLEKKHKIYGIATSDSKVEKWAQDAFIPCLYLPEENPLDTGRLFDFFSQHSFDYLFSIGNLFILRNNILGLPQRFAINYHNALLPKYGGINVTTWAIYNQEKIHGVSWHVMAEKVDAGDILKQCAIDVSEAETALTLNAKCFEAAIKSFGELIEDLAVGNVKKEAQNLDERSFFTSYQQPTPACLIDWHRSSEQIASLIRSLDFGVYPNPIGIPKIFIDGAFIITSKLDVLTSSSESPPGTILAIEKEHIVVSTTSTDVAVSGFSEIEGRPLQLSDIVERFELSPGIQFSRLAPDYGDRITAFNKKIHKHQSYWVKRLGFVQPIQLPYIERNTERTTLYDTNEPYKTNYLEVPQDVTVYHQQYIQDQAFGEYLLSVFAIYLARLTGTFKFDIGYQNSNLREAINEQSMQTLFSSYVPLSVDLDDTQQLSLGLASIKNQLKICKQRKTFSLDTMARYPELKSAPDIRSIINIVLAVVADKQELDNDDIEFGADFILKIPENAMTYSPSRILWLYKADKIDCDNVARMQAQFLVLLKSVIEKPEQSIISLPLLSDLERQQILVDWNDTACDYPRNVCIQRIFETQAEKTPHATALIFEEQSLSYAKLNQKANQLAHYLQELGVQSETLVGICLEPSFEMIIALLGILKAGGAYVPLDPAYPPTRLDFMIADSTLQFLITQKTYLGHLSNLPQNVIDLKTAEAKLAQKDVQNPPPPKGSDHLAYLLYTSGSTGQPKGVLGLHQGAVQRFAWMWRTYPFLEGEVCALKTSLNFVDSVWEIFGPLLQGIPLAIIPTNIVKDPPLFIQTLAKHKIFRLLLVPSLLKALLQEKNLAQELPHLRMWFCGGEKLTPNLCQLFHKKLKGRSLINLYGSSEVSADATYYDTSGWNSQASTVPIGRPLSNTQVYILDKWANPVPIGVAGEIYVGGAGLARGYFKRPELNAEKFVPHKFRPETDEKLYRTGDLGRYQPSGEIEYLGRLDYQINLRGFRIELGEIEAVLRTLTAIKEAVVSLYEQEGKEPLLTAYIVLMPAQTLDRLEVKTHLKKFLPAYMHPAMFVYLDVLPLNASGKINRLALPKPKFKSKKRIPAKNALELQLVQIWGQVFSLPSNTISVLDDFFALGGHSLLAAQLVAEIEKATSINLPLSTLLQAPTIRHLAEFLQKDWKSPWTYLVPVRASGDRSPLFLVPPSATTSLCFANLSHHLSNEQPIYGFDPASLDGKTPPHTTIEEIATHYLQEMCQFQPHGPYLLGGMCFGGLVAYEMAQQLQQKGQSVELLIILDAPAPTSGPSWGKSSPSYYRRLLKAYGGRIVHHTLNGTLRMALINRFIKINQSIKPVKKIQLDFTQKLQAVNIKAQQRYIAQPFLGHIALFQSSQYAAYIPNKKRWTELAQGKFDYYLYPNTTHSSFLREEGYIELIAKQLIALLADI